MKLHVMSADIKIPPPPKKFRNPQGIQMIQELINKAMEDIEHYRPADKQHLI